VIDVVKGNVTEPATGEVNEDGTFDDEPGFEPWMLKASTPYAKRPEDPLRVHPWYFGDHRLLRQCQLGKLSNAA
jgi:hypothetical protein